MHDPRPIDRLDDRRCVRSTGNSGPSTSPRPSTRSPRRPRGPRSSTPCATRTRRALATAPRTCCGSNGPGSMPSSRRRCTPFDADPENRPLYVDAAPNPGRDYTACGVKIAVVSDIHLDLRALLHSQGVGDFIDAYVLSFELGLPEARSAHVLDRARLARCHRGIGVDGRRPLLARRRCSRRRHRDVHPPAATTRQRAPWPRRGHPPGRRRPLVVSPTRHARESSATTGGTAGDTTRATTGGITQISARPRKRGATAQSNYSRTSRSAPQVLPPPAPMMPTSGGVAI